MANVMELMATLSLDTSEFENGLNGAKSKASTMGSTLMGGLKSAAKIGGAALGATTAAAGIFFKKSIDSGMQFDSAMSQVYATMGDNAQKTVEYNGQVMTSSEALRDFAQQMGATTAFSATESAEALNYMALAGYDAETSMKMLPNVLNLAAAGGMDLARSSDMITDAQTALGLSIGETETMVDQMAKASSTTNTSVSQLGEAFLTVGGNAKSVKGGTAELSSVLGVLADNGIKGSEAGTHLRNILLAMNPSTDAAAAAWEKLGVQAYDAEGNLRPLEDVFMDLNDAMDGMTEQEKTSLISDMFNKTDLASVNALLSTTRDRWEEVDEAVGNATGSAEKMAATQLDNLSGDMTLFKSALEGVYIAISDLATPALRAFVQFGTDGLSKLATALKEDGLAGAIPVFAEFVALGTQKLVESLPMFVEVGAQLLLAVVQGIIAALPSLIESLGSLLSTAIQFTSDTLNENLPSFGRIFDQIVSLVGSAVELIKAIWSACGTELSFIASTVWGMIATVVQSGLSIIEGIIKLVTAVIKGDWSGAWDAIKQIVSSAWNAIKSVVVGALATLGALVKAGLNLVKNTFTSIFNAVKSVVTSAFNGIKSAISSGLNAAKNVVTSVLNAIKSKFTSIFDGVKNAVRNAINTVKSIMNFSWHLPHLSLPHISISGGFSLNPLSVPHFGISWNKKALRNAYLLDDATIFGERGGTLLGGGEAGSEMIIGTGLLQGMIDESVKDATVEETTSDGEILKQILTLLRQYIPDMANMQLVTDTGALVGQLAPAMDAQLGVIARRRSYA